MSLRAATSFLAIAIALAFVPPAAAETASPEGAKVYFISPKDGDEISGPLTVKFGLSGMGVAPAGIEKPKTGHHHLLIDVDKVDMDNPLPADEHHKHFGGGQTETTITLPAGKHTLQLILGDHNHVPHKPPVMSDKITVTVK
ncbi:MAG: DUF4399 domain-containing protein [Hyphomicrobiaceae bacterium]|nr:DUF4399 domain-containing protein [Hyphomicrobiaceae bacterium]